MGNDVYVNVVGSERKLFDMVLVEKCGGPASFRARTLKLSLPLLRRRTCRGSAVPPTSFGSLLCASDQTPDPACCGQVPMSPSLDEFQSSRLIDMFGAFEVGILDLFAALANLRDVVPNIDDVSGQVVIIDVCDASKPASFHKQLAQKLFCAAPTQNLKTVC